MSYVKQNFVKGQTLKAEHLNYIESAVENLSKTEQPRVAQIIDGSLFAPTAVYFNTSGVTVTDVIGWYRDINKYNPTIDRLVMTNDGAIGYHCIGSEIIRNSDNTFNCKLYFGDELAPLIFDGQNNKILLDPDWVAPNVETLVNHCAFIKQNGEIKTGNIKTFEEACELLSKGANRFHATIAITEMQGDLLESETCHAISVRSGINLATGATESIYFYFESFHEGPFQIIWNSDNSLIKTEY